MFAHLIERKQSLVLDRFDDGALAHAVATADFGGVGHARRFVLPLMTGVAQVGFTKHQAIAHGCNVGAVAQQFEKPGAVNGIAHHHRADQFVVLDDKALVDTRTRIGEHDIFRALTARKVSGRE